MMLSKVGDTSTIEQGNNEEWKEHNKLADAELATMPSTSGKCSVTAASNGATRVENENVDTIPKRSSKTQSTAPFSCWWATYGFFWIRLLIEQKIDTEVGIHFRGEHRVGRNIYRTATFLKGRPLPIRASASAMASASEMFLGVMPNADTRSWARELLSTDEPTIGMMSLRTSAFVKCENDELAGIQPKMWNLPIKTAPRRSLEKGSVDLSFATTSFSNEARDSGVIWVGGMINSKSLVTRAASRASEVCRRVTTPPERTNLVAFLNHGNIWCHLWRRAKRVLAEIKS